MLLQLQLQLKLQLRYTRLHYTNYITLHYTRLQLQLELQLQLHYITLHYTNSNCSYHYNYSTLHYTTLGYATAHYTILNFISLHSLHHTTTTTTTTLITNYTSLQLQLPYATPTAALKHTTSSSCGRGDHCNHCKHSKKAQLQPPFRPSVDSLCHPWIKTTHLSYSVLWLKLQPAPFAVLLVYYIIQYTNFVYIDRHFSNAHWLLLRPIVIYLISTDSLFRILKLSQVSQLSAKAPKIPSIHQLCSRSFQGFHLGSIALRQARAEAQKPCRFTARNGSAWADQNGTGL